MTGYLGRSDPVAQNCLWRTIFENKCKLLFIARQPNRLQHTSGTGSAGSVSRDPHCTVRIHLGMTVEGFQFKYVAGLHFSHLITGWLKIRMLRKRNELQLTRWWDRKQAEPLVPRNQDWEAALSSDMFGHGHLLSLECWRMPESHLGLFWAKWCEFTLLLSLVHSYSMWP